MPIELRPHFIVIAIAVCLAALGTARAEDRKLGDLRFEPFLFKTGDGKDIAAELGHLVVPEQRSRSGPRGPRSLPGLTSSSDLPDPSGPSRRTIDLAFVRLKTTAPQPEAPVVVLAGGPGGSGITETRVFWTVLGRLLERSDVIALEQRGTGKSSPYLTCGSVDGFRGDDLVSHDHMLRALSAQFRPCADDWRSRGIDVQAYNTQESADDIEDLRVALGADKLRLWGFSFGSQLGLMTIRRHGEHIERAILAGVEGLDDTRKLPSSFDRYLAQIGRLVAADPAWSRRIPDFLALVKDVHVRLDREPRSVEIVDRSRQKRRVRVGGFALKVIVAIDASDTRHAVSFPALYHSIANGDDTLLAKRVQALQDRITAPAPWAMTYATNCASGATAARSRRIEREVRSSILGLAGNFPWPEICALWGNPDVGDALRSPLVSRVPVLFIAGTLDGRTPMANAQDLLKGFPNGVLFVVDNAGHPDAFDAPATVQAAVDFMAGKALAATSAAVPAPVLIPPVLR